MGSDEDVDGAHAESYRAAARAAAAELDEIDAAIFSLQTRLAALQTRSRALTAVLDALAEVVPEAVERRRPWEPTTHESRERADLPRRLRRRDVRAREAAQEAAREAEVPTADLLLDSATELLGPIPDPLPEPLPEVRLGVVPDVFAQGRPDVQAWG